MKTALLLSGGVDSSVALNLLLKEGGHDITAYYLKIWLEDEMAFLGDCPWEEDLKYARAVCEQAGVPLKVVSLQHEYHDRVVSYTIAELKAGRTPSPDIFCNQRIKFGAFFDRVGDEYDKIASGHYAQVKELKDGTYELRQGVDPVKDQTYFLSHLSQTQLSKILFPIGHLQKSEVREVAESLDLPTKRRKDSQGICFLGQIKYADFVKCHLGTKVGDIIDIDNGKVLGKHDGFWFHTIGQRKGLGLSCGPWFVVKKDVDKNVVYVSHNEFAEEKTRNTFQISGLNVISKFENTDALSVKIRHTPDKVSCTITEASKGIYDVVLAEEDRGIAAGQFAVIYRDNQCLGAGMIS